MKRFLYIASIIIAATFAASCETEPKPGGNDITSATFSFSLKVTEVGVDYAKISVKHDGPEEVTWYGFVAEDKKSTNDLILEKYNEFVKAGKVTGLKSTKNRTVNVDGLAEGTKYKYIVFAITEDVELYAGADAKSVEFTTGVNPYILTQTDEWTITRNPERTDNMEVVKVESKNAEVLYVWDYVSKEWVDSFNKNYPDGYDITDTESGVVLATLDAFQTYIIQQIGTIQYYVAVEGDPITDYTYSYDSSNPDNNTFMMPRISSGEYYFLAFGFYSDGSHTQTYSVSDVVVIEEEASTPGYEAWFGNYTFTGKGHWIFEDNDELGKKTGDEEDVTYNISIEYLDNNFMYLIKGWECGEGAQTDVETEFFQLDKETGDYLGFIGYYNDGKLEIRESTVTSYNDGENTMIFAICGYANDGKSFLPVMFDGTAMAEALPIAEGANSTTLNGLDMFYNGEKYLTYGMMGYILYDYATYQPVAIPNMPVKFPITIEKSDVAPAVLSSKAMKKDIMRKMKSTPISIEANKTVKPRMFRKK